MNEELLPTNETLMKPQEISDMDQSPRPSTLFEVEESASLPYSIHRETDDGISDGKCCSADLCH
jgi:hypothetical protein